MATINIKKEFVIEYAKRKIIYIDHCNALLADKYIDELMQLKTIFLRKQVYKSRTECIENENEIEFSNLRKCFEYNSKERRKLNMLLTAAFLCEEYTMRIDESDLVLLGFNQWILNPWSGNILI